jgi:hypothetical protein
MLAPLLLAATMTLPGGNLVLGREVSGRGLAGGPTVADGLLAPEGATATAARNAARAAALSGPESFLAVDLGGPRRVGALLIQADAGDDYRVEASLDGRSWTGLVRLEPGDPTYGLRTRRVALPAPKEVRFLLVHASGGDGSYAVGELAAFEAAPPAWAAPAATPAAERADSADGTLVGVRATMAALAALLLAWGAVLRRRGSDNRFARTRDVALLALGLLSAASFFNFGAFHFGRFVHVWDTYHCVVGSKYFPELGYTGLYEATLGAERAAGLLPPGSTLPVRDLVTNSIATANADDALARWRPRLGDRWADFVTDVLWFRAHVTPEAFRRILLDHGYNATPAWGIAGSALARLAGPVTDRSIEFLVLLDPLLLLCGWVLLGRAFGWRAACVALVFWGTNFPGRFYWNGGSFLRMDWLGTAMAGVALLKLRRPRLAGAALAASTLLRVFPAALLVGVAAAALARAAAERRRDALRELVPVARGALAAFLVAVPLSLLAAGGFTAVRWSAWGEFAANSRKHLATPLTNNVGLSTALAWRPATRGAVLADPAAYEPWLPWKEARRSALASGRPARLLLAVAAVAALGLVLRHRPPWEAAAAGAGLVFVLADLTCYYASVLLLLALLAEERRCVGVVTSLLAAATGAAPLLLPWEDDVYAVVSALLVAATVLVLALLARDERPDPATPRAARRRTGRRAPTPAP